MFLKKLLLILFVAISSFDAFSQINDYKANWKKVEDFEKKGLTQSAKEEVSKIYELAVNEKQPAQQIKSSIYLIKYRNMVEEESNENNIFYVDSLIQKATQPAKNILQSLQAETFWQYLQNNRWKIRSRTELSNVKSKDIRTWGIEKIYQTISLLYQSSLENEGLLKSTEIDGFDPVLTKGINTRNLRPTLYDFLTHRALDFFMTGESDLTKPSYVFIINDSKAFAPAAEFVKANFKTKDSSSLQLKAVLLLQNLLSFHLTDSNRDALLDADLKRLSYVNSNGVFVNKEQLYEKALLQLEERYADNPMSATASYLRANLYYQRGSNYDPFTNTTSQYEIRRAKELAIITEKKFPKSEGGINCHNLLSTILQPSLYIQTEEVNTINDPFRSFVKYKNIKNLYLRLIKTSNEELKIINREEGAEIYWKKITALKALKSWQQELPNLQDFQEHSTEIKIDGVDNGIYLLLASVEPDFGLSKNLVAKQLFYVSNISCISNNKSDYYVLDRNTGQPLSGASIQLWEREYNYNARKYDVSKAEKYITDANGFFKIKKTEGSRTYLFQIKMGKDELFMDEYRDSDNYYDSYEPVYKSTTFLFTDRSIYRPGQTIYFKGIVVQTKKDAQRSAVLPGFKTKVIVQDANYQKIGLIEVVSNEFGSYHGSFTLPTGGMNGQFSLLDSMTDVSKYIQVEEYKRPKFFVTLAKPAGTYRLNDTVKITGTAKAYAGNSIDGASVTYTVVRKIRYPIWWDWYGRGNNGQQQETAISNGMVKTDANGVFTIHFKAMPDETVDSKSQPTFYYEVKADVTDINGETRSDNTTVAVAYQMLQISIDINTPLPAASLQSLTIRSTNLNEVFEKTNLQVSINRLQSNDKILRSRYWEIPDQFTMSKDEFNRHFPFDLYKDEAKMSSWPVLNKTMEVNDSSNEKGIFKLPNRKWEDGWYKIIATAQDKYGAEVRAEAFLQLTAPANSKPITEPIAITIKKATANPGEQFDYSIATGFEKIWLLHAMVKMNAAAKFTYPIISNKSSVNFLEPILESDRGGMALSYSFVQHNRVYKGQQLLYVPWNNKDLKIEYSSFRDKILPGSKEKWSVSIKGNQGEKVSAEILAALYDASLDQFETQSWSALNIWPSLYKTILWNAQGFTRVNSEEHSDRLYSYLLAAGKSYDHLMYVEGLYYRNRMEYYSLDAKTSSRVPPPPPSAAQGWADSNQALNEVVVTGYAINKSIAFKKEDEKIETEKTPINNAPVQVRKNFNETAFFLPELRTDSNGNASFEFTMPEALTEWKLMTLAHTKDIASGYIEKTTITQKPLMVQPNAPRFFREGDKMEFSAKIVNLSDSEVTGTTQLELLDAASNKPVDGWFKNIFPNQYFTIPAGQSVAVKFPIEIPYLFNSALTYRIIAKTSQFSDGEEMALPVLTNRMLVTESMPLSLRGVNTKKFVFQKLLQSDNGAASTLQHHALTVEYTSNPAWYAVQALPYLMEYPYECAEQSFNRFYANSLASYVSNNAPKIKAVFDKWAAAKGADSAALLSNLQKNEELKSALLQETPWVLEAKNEQEQKKNIALLFDINRMSKEMDRTFKILKELQSGNGGFTWFKGGPDDRYMTQYIITGIGHLRKLNALKGNTYEQIKKLVDNAVPYLDRLIKEDYDFLVKHKVKLKENQLSTTAIQYLYMRSFFEEYKIPDASSIAIRYYKGQAKQYWLGQSKYMQAMIALSLHRDHDAITPKAILRSLTENAIVKEEMGMYWKEWTNSGYWWYQAPIESQALMIEAYSDIENNAARVDDLKTWLLKQKQTQNWKSTRATAEACYALLLNGNNWLNEEKEVNIQLGNTLVKSTDAATESGTGYFKKRMEGKDVNATLGNIEVSIRKPDGQAATSSSSWGAVYWQYFENLDKITEAATPLQLKKQLFIEVNTDHGKQLNALEDGAQLKVGDKVKVRIELRVDRDMEYVHMKDMRASCMEPVNVISEYKYQGGLGYYESTKDASTNFFFGWLNKGTYVFEYPLFVTHAGNFSNGVTSIQCMYAPEFTAHSEGIRISVE